MDKKLKNILITGGNGFLGSYIAKKLFKKYNIIILEKDSFNLFRLKDIINDIIIFDQSNYKRIFQDNKIDTIIHTATVYGRNSIQLSDLIYTNVLFPVKLIELGLKYGVSTFINTDSFFNDNKINYKYLGNYSLSKKHIIEWLKLLSGKLQIINLKLQHMYGPFDSDNKFVMQIINSLKNNIPEINLTLGEQKRDFIYIDDVVVAYSIILENLSKIKKGFSNYHIGTGCSISIKDFILTVHKLTNSKTKLNFGAIPYRENEFMDSKADLSEIFKFGWKPKVSLEEGLIKTINF